MRTNPRSMRMLSAFLSQTPVGVVGPRNRTPAYGVQRTALRSGEASLVTVVIIDSIMSLSCDACRASIRSAAPTEPKKVGAAGISGVLSSQGFQALGICD